MHKARRAKLDKEQKECESEGVKEDENEHAVGWGSKEMCKRGKEGEKKRESEEGRDRREVVRV